MSGRVKIEAVDRSWISSIGFDTMSDLVEELMEDHDFDCEAEAVHVAKRIIKGERIQLDNAFYQLEYINE